MINLNQFQNSTVGHDLAITGLTTNIPQYFLKGTDGDYLRTRYISAVGNVVWETSPLIAHTFTTNNGSTLVAGVLFNVDTRGNAPLIWSYPNQFTVNPAIVTDYIYTFEGNIQFRIGDYTSGTHRVKVKWDLLVDGVANGTSTEFVMHLQNGTNGVSHEYSCVIMDKLTLTAGSHTIGYQYYQVTPDPIQGTAGLLYRHNNTQIYETIRENR